MLQAILFLGFRVFKFSKKRKKRKRENKKRDTKRREEKRYTRARRPTTTLLLQSALRKERGNEEEDQQRATYEFFLFSRSKKKECVRSSMRTKTRRNEDGNRMTSKSFDDDFDSKTRVATPPEEKEDGSSSSGTTGSAPSSAAGGGSGGRRKKPPPPLPGGVHNFLEDNSQQMRACVPEEPLAPVVLHYPNCGFPEYRRKYERLGSFPKCWHNGQIAPVMPIHYLSRDWTVEDEGEKLRQLYDQTDWGPRAPSLPARPPQARRHERDFVTCRTTYLFRHPRTYLCVRTLSSSPCLPFLCVFSLLST